jgi:hypothetical protein
VVRRAELWRKYQYILTVHSNLLCVSRICLCRYIYLSIYLFVFSACTPFFLSFPTPCWDALIQSAIQPSKIWAGMHSSVYLYCHPAVCITAHCPDSPSFPEGHLKSKQSVCVLCSWGAHYLLLPDRVGECTRHSYRHSLYIPRYISVLWWRDNFYATHYVVYKFCRPSWSSVGISNNLSLGLYWTLHTCGLTTLPVAQTVSPTSNGRVITEWWSGQYVNAGGRVMILGDVLFPHFLEGLRKTKVNLKIGGVFVKIRNGYLHNCTYRKPYLKFMLQFRFCIMPNCI